MQQVVQYGNRNWLNSYQVDVMIAAIDHTPYKLVVGRPGEVEYVQGTGDGDYSVPDTDLFVGDPTDYGLVQVGDAVFGRTSRVTGNLDMDGTVVLVNRTNPNASNILFAMMDRTNSIRFALPKSAAGNATYNPRSMLNAGPAPVNDECVTVGYWQGEGIFDNLACDTSGTGADLGVQNDLEVEGDIFTDSIKGSTDNTDITIAPHGTGDIYLNAKVGIGTAAPGLKLTVVNDGVGSSSGIRIETNATANRNILDLGVSDSGYAEIRTAKGGSNPTIPLVFSPAGTEQMRIMVGGNVGIGTTAPAHHLQIQDASAAAVLKFGVATGQTGTILSRGVDASGNYRDFQIIGNTLTFKTATGDEGVGSAARMTLQHTTGNVGIGTASPAGKLEVDQSSAVTPIPVLVLDQADLSEEFIEFQSSVGSGYPIDLGAAGTYQGKIRISVNGTLRYIRFWS